MFESIRGRLLEREPASVVVDTGGLAYRLHVPVTTYEALPAVGQDAALYLHLAVREDEWKLFGFASRDERAAFRALLRVNGVGPVMALGVLSGFQPTELATAIGGGDVRALTRVKGVGRKTAERIVVELRDVWGDAVAGAPSGVPATRDAGPAGEAIRALEVLGHDPTEARKRVEKALAAGSADDVASLVRVALRG